MIKINYQFTCRGPLHTGDDVVAGTMRTLRRQAMTLREPVKYRARPEKERYEAILCILLAVWKSIDWDSIKGARLMGIYDEFAGKLMAAGRSGNRRSFLDNLCRSWDIKSLNSLDALAALEMLSDHELLETVRQESVYLMLRLRECREKKEDSGQLNFFAAISPTQELIDSYPEITVTRDMIPCISGNSFRGRYRRLAMADYTAQMGISHYDIAVYHTLFTGGFLEQKGQSVDLGRLEKFVEMCPMLGLMGAAVGNTMIEGHLKVGWAYPLCQERGTGGKSYWEYLDTVFQTRMDSSKRETAVELTGDPVIQQMKYEYEVFADGSPFEHRLACLNKNPLTVSAFWHLLHLFQASPFIGGMSAVGNGEVLPDWQLPPDGPDLYLQHLAENRETIREFWENARL